MKAVEAFLVSGLAVLLLQGCGAPEPVGNNDTGGSPLVGAWLIAETTVTGATGSSVDDTPEAGLYVFTERHFSNMLIPGGPRAPFGAGRSDEDRLAAYDNFIADAGTYEITGSTFTVTNIVAKVPNAMPPYRTTDGLVYEWQFDGDVLVLTLTGGWAPPDGEITYRLRRLE